MNSQKSDSELIEDYYRNLMSKKEKLNFEKKLQSNSKLKELFINYGQFFKLAEQEGNSEMKSFLQMVEKKNLDNNSNKTKALSPRQFKLSKLFYPIAAAFLLVIAGYFIFDQEADINQNNLFTEY